MMKLNEIAQNVDAIIHANFPPYEDAALSNLENTISELNELKNRLKEQNAREQQWELPL